MRDLPNAETEITLMQAALRLQEGYHATRTRMLRGEIRGRQIGRSWYLRVEDVERVNAARTEQVAQLA